MATCCNKFVFNEVPDTFQMWQGLRGPYFTPHVAENGDLSWSNNGQLPNPETVNIKGPPGPGGVPGGTTGQLLAKASDENYDTEWIDPPDLDAGHVEYDPAETYDDGSVGKELTTINSALSSLSSVTEIIDTASGAIASFPDGSGLPMRSLVAQIEPQQDLHGYDAPYPAGGGKNKAEGVISEANIGSTGRIDSATDYDIVYGKVTNGVTYTVTDNSNSTVYGFYTSVPELSSVSYDGSRTVDTSSKSFTAPIDGYVAFRVPHGFTTYQLEEGTSATAWTPYANICPISGHTGVQVNRGAEHRALDNKDQNNGFVDGYFLKNDGTLVQGKDFYVTNYISVLPNASCVLTVPSAVNVPSICFYDSQKQFISGIDYRYRPSISFNAPSNCAFARMSGNGSADIKIMANIDTFSVSFGQTVYGGTLDVVSGLLTVDRAEHTVSANDVAELFQTGTNANRVGIKVSDSQLSPTNTERLKIISNIAKADTSILTASAQKVGDCCMYSGGAMTYSVALFGVPTTATSSADARSWLVEQGCTFVYYLATPQIFALTPTQISTLLGQNNVWHDANGDTTVTYQANLKGYIDKKLA